MKIKRQPEMTISSIAPLPDDGETLNVLAPSGIGDFLWIWLKWCKVAHEQKVKFWFPDAEPHRAGQYCEIVGADYGYLPGLQTQWVWNQPGSPFIPKSGVVAVQANRHLESGQHLKEWYPSLPLSLPVVSSYRQHREDLGIVFIGHRYYMGGNLSAAQWARIITTLHEREGRVCIVGAGEDIEFAEEVRSLVKPSVSTLYNQHIRVVLELAARAKYAFGVAGGPTIAAQFNYCPTFFGYPRHFPKLPGTFESPYTHWEWSFVDQLESAVLDQDRLWRKLPAPTSGGAFP